MEELKIRDKVEINHTAFGKPLIGVIFNVTASNSPTSKVAGCKGFGLVQGLAPCA